MKDDILDLTDDMKGEEKVLSAEELVDLVEHLDTKRGGEQQKLTGVYWEGNKN